MSKHQINNSNLNSNLDSLSGTRLEFWGSENIGMTAAPEFTFFNRRIMDHFRFYNSIGKNQFSRHTHFVMDNVNWKSNFNDFVHEINLTELFGSKSLSGPKYDLIGGINIYLSYDNITKDSKLTDIISLQDNFVLEIGNDNIIEFEYSIAKLLVMENMYKNKL